MKLKGSSYALIVAMVIMLLAMVGTLEMGSLLTALFPLVAGGLGLLFAAIQLARELRSRGKAEAGVPQEGESQEDRGDWSRYLLNVAWVAGFVLAVYLLGFVAAIFLFVLSYMKWLGARLRTAIIFASIIPSLVYIGFTFGLQRELYPGLVFAWLGG